jgi:hypothetical protein
MREMGGTRLFYNNDLRFDTREAFLFSFLAFYSRPPPPPKKKKKKIAHWSHGLIQNETTLPFQHTHYGSRSPRCGLVQTSHFRSGPTVPIMLLMTKEEFIPLCHRVKYGYLYVDKCPTSNISKAMSLLPCNSTTQCPNPKELHSIIKNGERASFFIKLVTG